MTIDRVSEKFTANIQCSVTQTYTARQSCRITLLVPPFCLTAGGNLCQRQYKVLANIYKTSRDPWQNFMVDHHFFPVPVSHSFPGVLISPIGPKAMWFIGVDHIQLLAVAERKFPSQTKVEIIPTNIRPVINENIVWFWMNSAFCYRPRLPSNVNIDRFP